jgi:uncharacterized membrane protein YkvA (DUF1232 family)
MSDIDPRYLEIFPQYLRSLGEDAHEVGRAVEQAGNDNARRYLIAGLNYIFKSLDLIPDGIDDLGFMDDAFVLRVACALACGEDPEVKGGHVGRLADEAKQVKDFLDADYARLETYVRGLRKGAARGRTVEDILNEEATRKGFLHEVTAWGQSYEVPSFTRDMKTLIKLKAFLSAKLA